MFIETGFVFDDIDAYERFGIIVVKPDSSGMIQMPFGVNREIIQEKVAGNPIPFFYGVDENQLPIKINIMKENGKWSTKERKEIIQWLFQKTYKPLISYDNPDIAYFVLIEGEPQRYDTSLQEGYAELQFRSLAPWGYSYPKSVLYYPKHTLINNNNIITIDNKSNVQKYYYPEIQFEILSGTSFSVQNLSLQGETFEFTDLQTNEILYVNNNKKFIQSSLESNGIFRRDNFNGKWLRLIQGRNRLKIIGDVNLELRVQYPISV